MAFGPSWAKPGVRSSRCRAGPIRERAAREVLDHAIGDESAAVVAVVDDQGRLARLAVEQLLQHAVTVVRGVRQMDVADLAAGELVDQRLRLLTQSSSAGAARW